MLEKGRTAGKYTGCPNYSGGPGTAFKILQCSPELLSKLFRVLKVFPGLGWAKVIKYLCSFSGCSAGSEVLC